MRMSASSSTIRMSCAMAGRVQFHGLVSLIQTLWGSRFRGGKDEPDPWPLRLPIFQHQLSQVIFHDLFDDGETQAGSFRPGRNVWLGQPLAALLRQALTVVLDGHRGLPCFLDHRYADMAGCGLEVL